MKSDFSKMLEMDFKDYALQLHEDVVQTLEVGLSGEEPDPHSLAIVLRNYGPAYAFLITQHRLVKSVFIKANSEYEEKFNECYAHAAEECGSKATVKTITAKVAQIHSDTLREYKIKRDDLEQKTKIMSDMIQVFDRTVNALQSLGKILMSDFFGSRRS